MKFDQVESARYSEFLMKLHFLCLPLAENYRYGGLVVFVVALYRLRLQRLVLQRTLHLQRRRWMHLHQLHKRKRDQESHLGKPHRIKGVKNASALLGLLYPSHRSLCSCKRKQKTLMKALTPTSLNIKVRVPNSSKRLHLRVFLILWESR